MNIATANDDDLDTEELLRVHRAYSETPADLVDSLGTSLMRTQLLRAVPRLVDALRRERRAALSTVGELATAAQVRWEQARTDLRRMTEHAEKLAAEVAALRAEVETLRQGWQAERDAATRAHDLLIAERAVRS